MDPDLADEARSLIRSARLLLGELAEEADDFGPPPRDVLAPAPVEQPPGGELRRPEPRPAAAPTIPLGGQTSLLDSARADGPRPTLEQIREELGDCTRCRLSEGRTQIVFGVGNPNASLLFIGEGPGEQEDLKGIPFVGRAGELLTNMIERGLEIPRDDVYICNIVKCRPPKNRTPMADEVSACRRFLDGQIDAVAPRVIVTLGKPALEPPARPRHRDHPGARHLARVPRRSGDAHLSPGLRAAAVHRRESPPRLGGPEGGARPLPRGLSAQSKASAIRSRGASRPVQRRICSAACSTSIHLPSTIAQPAPAASRSSRVSRGS